MSLHRFDVRGLAEVDDETEEVLREGDPGRSLVRYRDDGSEIYVHVRLNVELLSAAAALPILRIEPTPREDEVIARDRLLTGHGSIRSYEFLERLCADIVEADCPARYIAEQHGEGRRDFYFATEDVSCLMDIANRVGVSSQLPLTFQQTRLAELAPLILPTELIGELDLDVPADARIRTTRFEFSGAPPSLDRLRKQLERRGYRFLDIEPVASELRVVKEVPIDGPGFHAVLREIVPLARSLRCSYRGTEAVGGFAEFALTSPLPARFAADKRRDRRWRFSRDR
jgi:hypothetical protein